jgi:hypothetical protein
MECTVNRPNKLGKSWREPTLVQLGYIALPQLVSLVRSSLFPAVSSPNSYDFELPRTNVARERLAE